MREPIQFEAPLCASIGNDFWYPEKEDGFIGQKGLRLAKSICSQCNHKTECAEWGINREVHGIWGGLAPRERQAIRATRKITLEVESVA